MEDRHATSYCCLLSLTLLPFHLLRLRLVSRAGISSYPSGYLPGLFFLFSSLFAPSFLFLLSARVILRDSGIYLLWTRLSHGSPSFSLEYTFRY